MPKKPKAALTSHSAREERNAEPTVLRSRFKPGDTKVEREAGLMVEGLAMNALLGLVFSSKLGTLDLTEAFAQILPRARETTERNTKSQEAILAGQIISMNAIYTDLGIIARQSLSNVAVFERLMRLALKAQSNCRATAEALASIQNPPAVFARQANFASGPQQINNNESSVGQLSRATNSESTPNKLLEAHGERLDSETQGAASSGHQAVATLGAFDRPQKRQR